MRLTFVNGKFVRPDIDPSTDKITGLEHWQYEPGIGLTTSHVPAALKFKKFADDVALRVLDRAYVKFYEPRTIKLPESFLKTYPPDPHQLEGISWMLSRQRSYLAHAPGAGKTYEAIVAAWLAMRTLRGGQTLFVVPPSLTANWVREIERFSKALFPSYWPSVAVIPESRHQGTMGWNADFIVVPDSMLAKPWVLSGLIKLRKNVVFVAVDEASRFKEPRALRSIALFGGAKGDMRSPGLVQGARHAVLMDGSPMPNRPMELWAPLFAMTPETIDFMSERDFGFKYCGAVMNDWGEWEFRHASHEAELNRRIIEKFMHIVPETALKHPERRRSIVVMNKDVRTPDFREWERKFLSSFNLKDIKESKTPMGCDQGELATRRAELGARKIPFIASYVRERAEKDESILLFAWHRTVCIQLAKALKDLRPALIMGGTKAEVRETWFQSFQKGDCKLIIGNIAAMGRGHNLQRADRIIFGEYSWTDELNKQCEKRASRRGSDKSFVRCEYIVAPNSIDEIVLNSVFSKARNVKRVIG